MTTHRPASDWRFMPGFRGHVIRAMSAELDFVRTIDPTVGVPVPDPPEVETAEAEFKASPEYAAFRRAHQALADAQIATDECEQEERDDEADTRTFLRTGHLPDGAEDRPANDPGALPALRHQQRIIQSAFDEAQRAARLTLAKANDELQQRLLQTVNHAERDKLLAELLAAVAPLLDKLASINKRA